MPSAATLVATFVAGLLSFLAPCTLPLLPAYLSYVGGVAAADAVGRGGPARVRGRLVAGACLYVAGFSTILVAEGLGIAGLGATAAGSSHRRLIDVVSGALLVGFGLALALEGGRLPLLGARRLPLPSSWQRAGPLGAFPLGLVVGIGWTPCVGPYLGAALALAATGSHASEGAVLLAVFAAGLGVPFIVAALVGASLPATSRLRRWAGPLARAGGVAIAALGGLLISGAYERLGSLLAQISTPR